MEGEMYISLLLVLAEIHKVDFCTGYFERNDYQRLQA